MINRINKRVIIYVMLMVVIFNIQISPASFADDVSFMGKTLSYDQIYLRDVDDNGYEELTFYMIGDQLVLSVWDTNENGINDSWFEYGKDDELITEAFDTDEDGIADQYFVIDKQGEGTLIVFEKESSIILIVSIVGGVLLLLLLFLMLKKKKGKVFVSLFLVMTMSVGTLSITFANSGINDDCSVNESVFDKQWLKYSDVDSLIELKSRSPEAKKVQSISDELRTNYADMLTAEFNLEIERQKRIEIKNIKKLLVRNIKNNLLKSFMRLTYVTYDVINNAYGNKGSIEAILDKSTAGLQIITSYIKMHKSLSLKSKTEQTTNTIYDSVKGIANSNALEALDSVLDPKKMATNLINDLQKEAFDVVKTEDKWDDANLSEADFKILKDQYNKNRDFDIALQESYLISSIIRKGRDLNLEAIDRLKGEYIVAMNEEKERVRDMLVLSCEANKEKQSSDDTNDSMSVEETLTGTFSCTYWMSGYDAIPFTILESENDKQLAAENAKFWIESWQDTVGAKFEDNDNFQIKLNDDGTCDIIFSTFLGVNSYVQGTSNVPFNGGNLQWKEEVGKFRIEGTVTLYEMDGETYMKGTVENRFKENQFMYTEIRTYSFEGKKVY